MKLRALIVDDEELAREKLHALLSRHKFVEVVGEAADGASAGTLLRESCPDVVFLDIEMPNVSGLDLMKQVPEGTKVVFVTAYQQYAVSAFDGGAGDYLLKPFSPPRLALALSRVRKRIKEERSAALVRQALPAVPFELVEDSLTSLPGKLILKVNDRFSVVPIAQISHILAERNYLNVYTSQQRYFVRGAMSGLLQLLEAFPFVRLGRSLAVNVEHVGQIKTLDARDLHVILDNGMTLRAHRSQCRVLLTKLKEWGAQITGLRETPVANGRHA